MPTDIGYCLHASASNLIKFSSFLIFPSPSCFEAVFNAESFVCAPVPFVCPAAIRWMELGGALCSWRADPTDNPPLDRPRRKSTVDSLKALLGFHLSLLLRRRIYWFCETFFFLSFKVCLSLRAPRNNYSVWKRRQRSWGERKRRRSWR